MPQPKLDDRTFILVMHSVNYNKLSAKIYRLMVRIHGRKLATKVVNLCRISEVSLTWLFNTSSM